MKIDKLNQYGNVSLHFNNKDFNIVNIGDMFNLVFASNGIFSIYKSNCLLIIDKYKGLQYKNSSLQPLKDFPSIIILNRKPNIEIYNKILEMFKYIARQTSYELIVNIYYDTLEDKFILDIMKQIVKVESAKGEYSEFEMNSRYIRYLQIHSHHSMMASFSAIDDKDEKNSMNCIFGVVGNITSDQDTIYTTNSKFRAWNGFNRFIDLNLQNVFDIEVDVPILCQETYNVLNEIIEISKNSVKNKPPIYTFQNNNQFEIDRIIESFIE